MRESWPLNPHEAMESTVKMIIIEELSFRFVENVGFRQMISICYPILTMPSCITIVRDIYNLYVDKKFERISYTPMSKGVCDNRCKGFTLEDQLHVYNYPFY